MTAIRQYGYLVVSRALEAEFRDKEVHDAWTERHWQLLYLLLKEASFKPEYVPGTSVLRQRGDVFLPQSKIGEHLRRSRDSIARSMKHLRRRGEVKLLPIGAPRQGVVIRLLRYDEWTRTEKSDPRTRTKDYSGKTTEPAPYGVEPAPKRQENPHEGLLTESDRTRTKDAEDPAPPVKEVQTEAKNSSSSNKDHKIADFLEELKMHGCTVDPAGVQNSIAVHEEKYPGKGLDRHRAKLVEVMEDEKTRSVGARMANLIRDSEQWVNDQVGRRKTRGQQDLDDLFEDMI